MKNLKMGYKMAVGFGSITLVMLALVMMFWNIIKNNNQSYQDLLKAEVEMAFGSRTADKFMLEGRRAEKDFLARLDFKYLEKHKSIRDKIIESIQGVKTVAQEKGYDDIVEKSTLIEEQAYHYHKIFSEVVAGYQKIGLTHDDGLRGQFKLAAEELAKQFNRFDAEKIETHYLFLRRWEKDYMRKGTEKYSLRLTENLQKYKDMLTNSDLLEDQKNIQLNAIVEYEQAFKTIISSGYNTDKAIQEYEKVRALAHVLEESINTILIKDSSFYLATCRKNEKDYLMLRDKKYVEDLKSHVGVLENKIANSKLADEHKEKLNLLLENYKSNFLSIVEQDEIIGSKEKGLIGAMRKAVHQIEEPIKEIIEVCNQREKEKVEALSSELAERRKLAFTIVGLTCIVVLLFVIYLTKSIARPLQMSVELANCVAKGDLTKSISVHQNDEIGMLASSLNKMSENLNHVISEMVESTETISTRSEDMTKISDELKDNSEETKVQAESVASATEEMSANISSIASATEQMNVNINSVASSADQMSNSVNEVSESMQQMSENIKKVAENSRQASGVAIEATSMSSEATQKMNELNEAGQEIDKVTEVIKRIAEQTNLLALNATIEAASAGEAGKGFAVVAGEIKELANQSAQAAEDIAIKIEGVQNTTKDAVEVIDGVTSIIGNINDSVSLISDSVEKQNIEAAKVTENISDTSIGIKNIAKSISEINKGTGDLSKNVAEGAKGTNDVSKNIQDVSAATNDGQKNAEQVSQVSTELDQLSKKMRDVVCKFNIKDTNS